MLEEHLANKDIFKTYFQQKKVAKHIFSAFFFWLKYVCYFISFWMNKFKSLTRMQTMQFCFNFFSVSFVYLFKISLFNAIVIEKKNFQRLIRPKLYAQKPTETEISAKNLLNLLNTRKWFIIMCMLSCSCSVICGVFFVSSLCCLILLN